MPKRHSILPLACGLGGDEVGDAQRGEGVQELADLDGPSRAVVAAGVVGGEARGLVQAGGPQAKEVGMADTQPFSRSEGVQVATLEGVEGLAEELRGEAAGAPAFFKQPSKRARARRASPFVPPASLILFPPQQNGHLKSSPVAPVKVLKQNQAEKQRRRAFTLDELRTIFVRCPDDFWRFAMLGGFYIGQRLGDLVCMNWGAVDLHENVLRLRQGKTDRIVQVPPCARPSAPCWSRCAFEWTR